MWAELMDALANISAFFSNVFGFLETIGLFFQNFLDSGAMMLRYLFTAGQFGIVFPGFFPTVISASIATVIGRGVVGIIFGR